MGEEKNREGRPLSGQDVRPPQRALGEALKGAAGERQNAYYVFLPIATFSFRGKSFCKSDAHYPALPAVGDSLLLFIRERRDPGSSYLELLDATDLIVIKADSTLDLPFRFRGDPKLRGLDGSALLQEARRQVQAGN